MLCVLYVHGWLVYTSVHRLSMAGHIKAGSECEAWALRCM